MTQSYDLAKIGSKEFENLVNCLALAVLGAGHTGFSPGADGGRDGYFEGQAPYPSLTNQWKGVWYIQSKFHAPHLSKDAQKWLIEQVKGEIKAFESPGTDRHWPDNWIIATNVVPTAKPKNGSFDAIRALLKKTRGGKRVNVDIWGGQKLLSLLIQHPHVAAFYKHFLTPGHVISRLYDDLNDTRVSIEEIARYFVATQFVENRFTKLDQAGSSSDVRASVHELFIDLPYRTSLSGEGAAILAELSRAVAQCHKHSVRDTYPEHWRPWGTQACRARVALLKGGPGQGKSTIGQYLCQIHRAFLILDAGGPPTTDSVRQLAQAIKATAINSNLWPSFARIPIQIELKEFAHWFSQKSASEPRGILSYVAHRISQKVETTVLPKTLKRALSHQAWLVVFDGLDEVPNDHKDVVAGEVLSFLNDLMVEVDADLYALCTSRPQGYSGQFAGLEGPVIELTQLNAMTAMLCASPVLRFDRNQQEYESSMATLSAAIQSPSVQELMTTPLQSHIMAVIVRDGGRPPERRWNLFNSFYQVMKKRESQKEFHDDRIAKLLREEDRLLRSVHVRLGFVLHANAERSEGAQTTLSKEEFRQLVRDVVKQLVETEIEETVTGVMEATTERLVLVSTPESGSHVRFDIRQLQEFFAAEFLYSGVDHAELRSRIETVGGDAHWREVVHFLLSALVENQRTGDLSVAVQVLRLTNEGPDGNTNSAFHRRMARAGLLVARLLAEGVLEQDQRDRQQVKPLLEPLSGLFDLESLKGLADLKVARSRLWLTNLLIDRISDASARESVGAIYMLGWLLGDQASASQSATIAFKNIEAGFQRAVIEAWMPSTPGMMLHRRMENADNDTALSQWVITLAVELLKGPEWSGFDSKCLSSLIVICSSDQGKFRMACAAHNIKADASAALWKCITGGNENRRRRRSGEAIDCGLLAGRRFSEDWLNAKVPTWLRDWSAKAVINEVGGYFHLLLSCAWWAQCRDEESLTHFTATARMAGRAIEQSVPPELLALIPVEGAFSLNPCGLDQLLERGQADVGEWLAKLKSTGITPPMDELSMRVSAEKRQRNEMWRRFATTVPVIAVNSALQESDWAGEPEFVPELVTAIKSNPHLAAQSILGWGTLAATQPDLLEFLKKEVGKLAPHRWGAVFHRRSLSVNAFTLKKPGDLPLLKVLAPAIIYLIKRSGDVDFGYSVEQRQRLSMEDLIGKYGFAPEEMNALALSAEQQKSVRSAALALYWLYLGDVNSKESGHRGSVDLNVQMQLYDLLVDEFNEGWLTRALVGGLLGIYAESNAAAVSVATRLIERCLDGGGPREEVVELIRDWRERSTAPVLSKQVMREWLGYSFETPNYISR